MRVAIIAECFLPERNGVTNSVLRVVEHLEERGHQALVIAPGLGPTRYSETPVERVPGVELPVYRSLSVGLPTGQLRRILEHFAPDVVHAAAPAVLGAAGLRAAADLGLPSVAIYQTDLAGFARRYGFGVASPAIWRWLRWVHGQAGLTLAPSTLAAWELERNGIPRVARWGRGVDLDRFHPRHRNALLRRRLVPNGEVLVGYIGRLAPEKQVHLLAGLAGVAGVNVVVAGDGPSRAKLERQLPGVSFLGFKSGPELSQLMASLDVFVHTGANETFCQAIQEALASGVPVVAPASGGPVDLVRHGETGWLVPAGRPSLVRPAVLELVRDAELRQEMGRRARASVAHRSWGELGDELIEHYRRVGGGGGRRRRVA
ncbi:MAG TPA: glycosyltransferase family 1 protein [Acidimicrobiales bacterium]